MTNILTGQASTIPGFSSVSFDLGKALSILHWFETNGYSYGLGAKVIDITKSPPVCRDASGIVDEIDCSGFHRYVIYHATGGLVIPDGSSNQNDWYAAQGFKHHSADGMSTAYTWTMSPGYLYACFCRAGTRGESIGHVWLCFFQHSQPWTLESHGGKGPDSRIAVSPPLPHICTDFYPIAKVG